MLYVPNVLANSSKCPALSAPGTAGDLIFLYNILAVQSMAALTTKQAMQKLDLSAYLLINRCKELGIPWPGARHSSIMQLQGIHDGGYLQRLHIHKRSCSDVAVNKLVHT